MAITFQKRQKEMKRLEKQREKAERREQRKIAKKAEKEAGVEQVEMELRRKVDEATNNGTVRSPGSEKVPEGYAKAVEEYYRKLSNKPK